MKNKNNNSSNKIKNSKSLLSCTIEYIKNDLKNEYNFNEDSKKKDNDNYINIDISNTRNSNINQIQEQISQKQSKLYILIISLQYYI